MAKKGNTNALKYGGGSAVKAITAGTPFNEPAATVQKELERAFDTSGVYEYIKERMLRLATAEQLYWNACQMAAEKGEVKSFEGRIKIWGWLIEAELRALVQLDKIGKHKGSQTLDAVLHSYQAQKDVPGTQITTQGEAQDGQDVKNDQGVEVKDG